MGRCIFNPLSVFRHSNFHSSAFGTEATDLLPQERFRCLGFPHQSFLVLSCGRESDKELAGDKGLLKPNTPSHFCDSVGVPERTVTLWHDKCYVAQVEGTRRAG